VALSIMLNKLGAPPDSRAVTGDVFVSSRVEWLKDDVALSSMVDTSGTAVAERRVGVGLVDIDRAGCAKMLERARGGERRGRGE
jgi:hypothetical protein